MKRKTLPLIALLAVLMLISSGLTLAAPAAPTADWQSKVDPWVLNTARAQGETEFLVYLADQADLSAADALTTKLEKGTFVYETLSRKAAETQGPVLDALKASGAEYRAYWVANMVWVRGRQDTVESMARRADVAHIYANPTVHFDEPVETILNTAPVTPDTIEWNIALVNAPQVWAAGFTGQGAVIGGQDTGYQWDHPALKNQYRGWNGSSADNNYNWHDSIHSGGGVCGANSAFPCDDHGHGTHTMGTMVGDDGAGNQVGMAPGARWIGCRNMDQGNGTPASYSECYQWFIAPTDLNDANPNPAMAPDVISNSWSCPVSEGCTDPNVMLTLVNNVRAAGILSSHSAGNSGSACSTVSEPAGIYDASYTVGSTTSSNTISSFSSRGPVTVDGSNRLKPDISAPGSSIRSTYPTNSYATLSGTSMAAPHVAGLVGLLISVRPDWAGNVDQLENTINATALGLTTTQECGGIPGSQIPNNTFGYGRIDAFAAYQAAVIPTAVALSGFAGSPAAMPANALPMLALPAATGLALAGAYVASKRRRS